MLRGRMRIALVHYTCLPITGGVEIIVGAHARLLAEAGHEVRIICRRGGEDNDRVIRLTEPEPIEELRTALAGCDVVIAHNVMTMPFDLPLTTALWTLAEELVGTRFLAWLHDLAACNHDYPLAFHEPPWLRLAQASPHFEYVAISRHRAGQFTALTGTPVRVIPNGVEPREVLGLTPAVSGLADAHGLWDREIVLLHPTRLLPRKNVERGLEVAAELRARGRRVAYLVTAAPDAHNPAAAIYAAELARRRRELDLESVALFLHDIFPVTTADLVSLYALSDALFFPSRQEGFGLPVLEATLHRLPVFCADLPPMNNLVEHALQTFAPEATPAEIATGIERTLDLCIPHRSRHEVLARYGWTTISRDFLQPLLAGKLPLP